MTGLLAIIGWIWILYIIVKMLQDDK